MKHQLTQLSKQSAVYGASGVATSIVGLITLPIFARLLTTEEYGVLELAVVVVSALMVVVDIGLASAAQRSYFDYSDDEQQKRRAVLTTALTVSLGIALLITVLGIAGSTTIVPFVLGSDAYTAIWIVSLMALPVGLLAQFTREIMRLRQRPWPYLASSVIVAVGGGFLGVALALHASDRVLAIQIAGLAGAAASAAFGFVLVRRDLALRFSRHDLSIMLAYGLPLVPSAAALWGLALVDRLILARLGSLADVGLYAIANRFSSVELLLVSAFALAYSPFVLSLHKENREEELRVRARVMTYLTLTLLLGAMVLSLAAREVITVVAPAFAASVSAAIILTFAIGIQGVGAIALAGISIARSTRSILVVTMIAVAVNIGLCFLLIPRFAYLGAAVATLVAYAMLSALYFVGASRVETVHYEVRKLIAIAAITGGGALVGLVAFPSWWIAMLCKTIVVGVAVLLLIATGVVGPEEREFVGGALRRARRSPS